ncbi:MAG: hypothetical protein M3Y39_03355 [Chloroflexota bacterium]|nr:hypothetical protein [Chloroflexota bacterium]
MSSFELIAQELVKQQQHMQMLDAENRELRRQLADLRAGYGIFIEIAGQRFPLEGEILLPQSVTSSTEEDLPMPRTTTSLQEIHAPIVNANEAIDMQDEEEEEFIPAVESVSAEATPVEIASSLEEDESEQEAPTFLEEIMLDEFAAAATSPMAVWNGPIHKQEGEPIDEEQKAALRRELMGSFLLE